MERKTVKGILNQIIRLKLYLTVDMREDCKAPYKTILYREGKGTNGKVTGNRIKTLRGLKSRPGQSEETGHSGCHIPHQQLKGNLALP